ncbi:MAG: hypothetical protein H8E89_03855 [Candidatus Nitrosopelagicus sp.]|nr:hypothetical protein [Candidatus Nitrosopelagicus sp.]|tara:strand:- start:861 stop:1103 length:243 start_codon:yes stop_codon:yes gene_type:complete
MDITNMNRIPRNIFVLIIANMSKAFESLNEKICVTVIKQIIKIPKYSIVNILRDDVIMKNQKEKPAVTANALKRGEDRFI